MISLLRSDSALVVMRLMPRAAASSLMDCVSAIRKGLASFSDCAKPIVAVARSMTSTPVPPYAAGVQRSPSRTSWTTCSLPVPAEAAGDSSCARAVMPARPAPLSATAIDAPNRRSGRFLDIRVLLTLSAVPRVDVTGCDRPADL